MVLASHQAFETFRCMRIFPSIQAFGNVVCLTETSMRLETVSPQFPIQTHEQNVSFSSQLYSASASYRRRRRRRRMSGIALPLQAAGEDTKPARKDTARFHTVYPLHVRISGQTSLSSDG